MTLRKVNVPLGDGWVLYSTFGAERTRRVLGGRRAGDSKFRLEDGM